MPTRLNGEKRPADPVANAVRIGQSATRQAEETCVNAGKRSGGREGGPARADKLSPERRREMAERAAAAGWGKASSLGVCLSLGALLLLASGSPEAQQRLNLTKAQEGRAEVAKCYSRCMGGTSPVTMRIALDALDGEWSPEAFQYVTCLTMQSSAQALDACRSGCSDIEAGYGVRSSHIRTRFHYLANDVLREIRAAGLWTAWNRYPAAGSNAFIRACARYVSAASARIAQAASKLRAVEPEGIEAFEARLKEVMENEHVPEAPPAWEE